MEYIQNVIVVSDTRKAVEYYQKIFQIEVIELTNYEKGLNEAIFRMYGSEFHLLDENEDYNLVAFKQGENLPISFNIMTENINVINEKLKEVEGTFIQELTDLKEMGVKNLIFADKFGLIWLAHEKYREVTFEERKKIFEKELNIKEKE